MGNLFIQIKNISNKYSLHITGAACIGNFLVGTGKLFMGLLMGSISAWMGVFLLFRLKRIQKKDGEQEMEYDTYISS